MLNSILDLIPRKTVTVCTHSVLCFTTGPKPLPKKIPHTERSSAASFNLQYPVVSLMLSSSCLRLLPRLPVSSIFPSIRCFRRQFLCKMWQILLAFLRFILRRILFYLTQCNTSSFLTRSVQLIFSILLQHYISKLARCF